MSAYRLPANPASTHRPSEEFTLETHELTKEFKGFVAVDKVNLRVRRGTIHALIGPNGAARFNLLTDLEAYAAIPAVELSYGRQRAPRDRDDAGDGPDPDAARRADQGMGLDDVDRIRALIKKVAASRTVLMVEHNMSVVASIADTIMVLARGATLAEGPYAEVAKNPAVIEAYTGTASAEPARAH